MIEDMYSVMQRIHEIRARFGLARRHPAAHTQPVQVIEQPAGGIQAAGDSPQVRGIDASWPQGSGEVQQAINYIIGQGTGGTPSVQQTQNGAVHGLSGLLSGGNAGGQNFFQTLLGTIRSDDTSDNE